MPARLTRTQPQPGRQLLVIEPAGSHTATLLWMHGLGDSSEGWAEPLEEIANAIPGLKVIAPTAPQLPVTVSGGGRSSAWCDIACTSFNPMELLGILEKRPPYVEQTWSELLNMISKELEASPQVGLERWIIGGFSLGGHMATWIGLQLPRPCAGVLLVAAVIMGSSCLQVNSPTEIFHAHGQADQVIPLMGAQICRKNVIEAGLAEGLYQLKEYAGVPHSISPDELQDAVAFLQRRLKESVPASEPVSLPLAMCSNGFSLKVGTAVTIGDLKSKPHLNGQRGVVAAAGLNPRNGRYSISVGEETLALQKKNLSLVGIEAEVGEGSGSFIQVVPVPGEEDVWDEVADAGSGRRLKSEELRFRSGGQVVLSGLRGVPAWNGCIGQVGEFLAERGRYRVELGNSVRLDVKAANLSVC